MRFYFFYFLVVQRLPPSPLSGPTTKKHFFMCVFPYLNLYLHYHHHHHYHLNRHHHHHHHHNSQCARTDSRDQNRGKTITENQKKSLSGSYRKNQI